MKKTSVYLPDELKEALAEAATRAGRSEADTIRLALERFVHTSEPAPPSDLRSRRPTPPGPRLVGVGVGPGDPDLLTGRARRILGAADRVFAASISPDAVSRAEAVVYAAAPGVVVERLVLHVGPSKKARRQALQAAAERIASCLDRGELVAFATLGDPHIFSAFPALAVVVRQLRPAATVDGEPGILAFQQLAAATSTTVAGEGEQVTLVTLGDNPEALEPLFERDDSTVVIYKGGRHLPEVATALSDRNRLAGAVAGELLGQPGERCLPLAELASRPGSYLATAIIPARRNDGESARRPRRRRNAGGGPLISFVGAGPGAPDLITLRGAERLAQADVIIWAGSLVPPSMLDRCRPDAIRHDSSVMTLNDVTAVFATHPDSRIVRLHSGDPTVYSAIAEQIDWCRANGRDYEVVPGVSSVSATAAAAGRELTVPGLAQTVVLTRLARRTAASVPEHESVAALARRGATMALYLSAGDPEALQAELLCDGSAYTPATPAVIGYRVSWPDEILRRSTVGSLVESLAELGKRTSVMILVGDVLADTDVPAASHVYSAAFGHAFRDQR